MQHLKAQRLAQDAGILVGPHVITRRAGGDQASGANRSHCLHVVARQLLDGRPHAGDLKRKATTPFLPAQRRKVVTRLAPESARNSAECQRPVDTWRQRSPQSRPSRRQIWHPDPDGTRSMFSVHTMSVGVVLSRDIVLSRHPLAQEIKSLGVLVPGHQLLPHRDPQRAGVDPHRTDVVAASAQRALIHTLAKVCQFVVSGRLHSKETRQPTQVISLPKAFGLRDLVEGVDRLAARLEKGRAGSRCTHRTACTLPSRASARE